MGQILKETWRTNVWLRILTISAILLIAASFIIPPTGVIDGSVLAAVGELEGFGALWIVAKAVDKGMGVSLRHNNTEISTQDAPQNSEEDS